MRVFLLLLFSSVHLLADGQSFAEKLSIEASKLPAKIVRYDPSYYSMPYPGGNPPEGVGVCTDVVIWSYRSLGYDLQLLIHESRLPEQFLPGLFLDDRLGLLDVMLANRLR